MSTDKNLKLGWNTYKRHTKFMNNFFMKKLKTCTIIELRNPKEESFNVFSMVELIMSKWKRVILSLYSI